jgi:hypothetical protein
MNYPSYADFVATRPVYRLFGRVYKAGNNTWQDGNAATNEPDFELSDGDFVLNQNTISVESGSSVPFGNAVCRTATLTLVEATKYESADFVGACIYVYVKAYADNTSGSTFIPFGTEFFVTEVVHESGVIKVTAQDAMCKADKEYIQPYTDTRRLTIKQIFDDVIAQIYGVSAITAGLDTFLNSGLYVRAKPRGYTCRQMLSFIAQIACGNVVVTGEQITGDGKVFPKFAVRTPSTAQPYNTLDKWISLEDYSEEVSITGLRNVARLDFKGNEINPPKEYKSSGYTDTYPVTLENPLLAGSEISLLAHMYETVYSWTFHKFKGKHIGYPLAEYGDYAVVTHRGGTFNTFLTNITWNISGATEFECNIDTAAENAADYDNSNGTIEKIEDEEPTTQVFDKPTTFNSTAAFNGAASFADAATFDGSVKLSSGAELHGEIEVYGAQPHIDFHYGNSTSDYTSRIIETENGKINIAAPNGVSANGTPLAAESITLTANTDRITNVSYAAKYIPLLGAVFVRIYGKISATMNTGYDYDLFTIDSRLPNSIAALSVKCGKNAMANAKAASGSGAIQIRPLESGIKGYDVYITGFWFV